jgi:hypothetical protein
LPAVRRRLLNLLTALSLVLCVTILVLWAQSYAGSAGCYLLRSHGYSELAWLEGDFYISHGGSVGTRWEREQWGRSSGLHGFWDVGSPGRPNLLREARFVIASRRLAVTCPIWNDTGIFASYRIVRVPCWAATLVLALLPAWAILRHVRSARRHTRGQCPSCGYDLRSSPDRCPECGMAIPVSAAL